MNKNKKAKFYIIIFSIIVVLVLIITIIVNFKKDFKTISPVKKINEEKVLEKDDVLGRKDDLVYFSIKPYDKVGGIVVYDGLVKNGYFFEANILINILDADKNIVLRSHASAKSEWMTSEPVLFEGVLDLSKMNSGLHYLEIHNDNASGLPEHDKSILIPIIIN